MKGIYPFLLSMQLLSSTTSYLYIEIPENLFLPLNRNSRNLCFDTPASIHGDSEGDVQN